MSTRSQRIDDALAGAGQFAGVLAILVGLGFGLWGLYDERVPPALHSFAASYRSEHLTLYVYTPHVTPGESVTMELEARHFTPVGIDSIEVFDGVETAIYPGEGRTWGHTISIAIPAPDVVARKRFDWLAAGYLPPGETCSLAITVRYTLTRWLGAAYDEERREEIFYLPLAIHTSRSALVARGLAAVWASLFLLLLCGAAWWVAARVARRELRTGHSSKIPGSVVLAWIAAGLTLRHAGWAPFAIPWGAALGSASDGVRSGLGWVWAFAPMAAALAGWGLAHAIGRKRAAN